MWFSHHPAKSVNTTFSCITPLLLPFSTLYQPSHIPPPPSPHHHDRLHTPKRAWRQYCVRESVSGDEMQHCSASPSNPHDHKSARVAYDHL